MPTDPELFVVQKPLPPSVASMPMLQCERGDELIDPKRSDEPFQKRVDLAVEHFAMNGATRIDQRGDRAVVTQDSRSMEVFRASDSVWWTDHGLAYADAPLEPGALPTPDVAIKLAYEHAARFGFDLKNASSPKTTYGEASAFVNGQERGPIRTTIDVNFRFRLDEWPIFGPGAKSKLTFGAGGTLAQALYFHRNYVVRETFTPVTSDVALERFQRDTAFFRLNNTGARIDIHDIRLGYYALPPARFQRFYVPVYAVDATVSTKLHPSYRLRRFVVARDLSPREAKKLRAVANPSACRLF